MFSRLAVRQPVKVASFLGASRTTPSFSSPLSFRYSNKVNNGVVTY